LWREKTREPEEQPGLEWGKKQQLIQPTYMYDAWSRIQTPIPPLSLGGKHSNHCAIPAPLRFVFYGISWARSYNGLINVPFFLLAGLLNNNNILD